MDIPESFLTLADLLTALFRTRKISDKVQLFPILALAHSFSFVPKTTLWIDINFAYSSVGSLQVCL